MQLENIEKIEENLENEDEHIINMWTPLDIEIDEDYDYIKEGIMFKIASTLLYIIVWPILVVYNKIMYNFKIYGRKNLTKIKTGKITVSNHVHPMDCTMNAIANTPKSLYFVSIKSNFEIPVIRHIIRLLHAFPIPEGLHNKEKFFSYGFLNDDKIFRLNPQRSSLIIFIASS